MSCDAQGEFVCGNLYIRPIAMAKAGAVTEGHCHNFDHMTQVLRGGIRVTATSPDGTQVTRDFTAPTWLLIRADTTHRIEALVDDTLYWCVYAHRNPQGEVVQEFTGWAEAYK